MHPQIIFMSLLFSPLQVGSLTLKNRIVVSPMCQYTAVDGFANDWHLVHLGSRAVGGAALVIQEATAVTPEGRISPDDVGIWKDEHIEKLRQITSFINSQGAIAGIQLAHAGRKASLSAPWKGNHQLPESEGGWQTVAPSPLPMRNGDRAPHALTIDEIKEHISAFADAADRAVRAGYDVIEIHGAHGYLVHQFLSPLSNIRNDEYGGSFDNRVRFMLEIVDAVKKKLNKQVLFVRISATDWAEGGWDITQSVALVKLLQQRGVSAIDVSTGGNVSGVKIPLGPGYQVRFAEQIKKETGVITGAVGLLTEAVQCETILQQGQADLVFLARELLRDPYFPLHASMQLDKDAVYPVQYERAKLKP